MDIKLGHWHNKSHEGRAVLRIYANQPTHPLWQVWLLSNFNLQECLFPALAISRCAEAWTPSIIVTARPQFYESQSYTKIALFMLFNASSRGQLCRGAGGARCWPGSWLKHLSDIFCRVQQFKYTEEHWGLHYLGLGWAWLSTLQQWSGHSPGVGDYWRIDTRDWRFGGKIILSQLR